MRSCCEKPLNRNPCSRSRHKTRRFRRRSNHGLEFLREPFSREALDKCEVLSLEIKIRLESCNLPFCAMRDSLPRNALGQ